MSQELKLMKEAFIVIVALIFSATTAWANGCDKSENEIAVTFKNSKNQAKSRLLDYSAGGLENLWGFKDTDDGRGTIQEPTAAGADLNGDGTVELVQVFRDENSNYQLAALTPQDDGQPAADFWRDSSTDYHDHRAFAVASGDLIVTNNSERREIVTASQSDSGALHVNLWKGSLDGGIKPNDGNVNGLWRSEDSALKDAEWIDVTAGNLDGDGEDEIVVAVGRDELTLLVLRYLKGHEDGTDPDDLQDNLELVTQLQVSLETPFGVQVAIGDIDGDGLQEIALGYGREPVDAEGTSDRLTIRTYRFESWGLEEQSQWDLHRATDAPALDVGDTDNDGREEIVVGFRGYSDENYSSGLWAKSLDASSNNIVERNSWSSTNTAYSSAEYLSLAVGDLDGDDRQEVVAGFRETGDNLQVLVLREQQPGNGFSVSGKMKNDSAVQNVSVALIDWDNDSCP